MTYKLFGSIFVVLFTLASLVPDAPQDISNTDTHAELQEIYAHNLALSPNTFLPVDYISDTALLEEIYASGLAVSNNLTISR